MLSFDELDLDDKLIQVLEKNALTKPTTIQQLAIPVALEGKDIMASAPTGTGKTLAFLLPTFQYLLDFRRKDPGPARVLVMSPTRELAHQIYEQACMLAKATRHKVGLIIGGTDYELQHQALEKNQDIVIATPGRLIDLMDEESFDAQQIEVVIIDEADRMLEMGQGNDIERILGEARWRRQTQLFSATLESGAVKRLARDKLKDAERIEADPPRREKGKIHQWLHLADDLNHKQALLLHYLQHPETQKSIVFVKKRERVMELVFWLQRQDIKVSWLQGNMPQDKRLEAVQDFVNGKTRILIATDVAARGLDIEDISHVFNFDMPRNADVYVHRIGRTARGGKKGNAVSFVEAHDVTVIPKIERYTDQQLKRRVIKELAPKHKEAKLPSKKKKPKKKVKKPKKK